MDNRSPKDGFRGLLDRAEEDGWIASYRWVVAETFGLLKIRLGGPCKEGFSRTQKRGTDGNWYALEVEAHYGTSVGVDLELLMPRPILDNPEWIMRRMGMTRVASPRAIIEEWSSREAAYRALTASNINLKVSQFRRTAPGTLTMYTPTGDQAVQVRNAWAEKWVLSLGWRSLT